MDVCVSGLSKRNSTAKEEILGFLMFLYTEYQGIAAYPSDKVLREVAPLMEDPKTKIKIKTVECLVGVSLRTNKNVCMKILSSLLNKVYYEMFLEKLREKESQDEGISQPLSQ